MEKVQVIKSTRYTDEQGMFFYDHDAPFPYLLVRKDETTVHAHDLQRLMIEIYKTLHDENPLLSLGHAVLCTGDTLLLYFI